MVAVDQAPSMVEHAREALGGARARCFQADLTELELAEPVDAVFSNAVFHWIPDHDRLFARLHAALRPGGRLVAQCGGEGNVERFHEAAREVSARRRPSPAPRRLGRAPGTSRAPRRRPERLERAGFGMSRPGSSPTRSMPEDPANYLRTVCLGYHLEQLPEELRDRYRARRCWRDPARSSTTCG